MTVRMLVSNEAMYNNAFWEYSKNNQITWIYRDIIEVDTEEEATMLKLKFYELIEMTFVTEEL